jgi:hypothetical protein
MSRITLPVFISMSAPDHPMTNHPKTIRERFDGVPIRTAVSPKSILNMQKGIPMLRLKKNGRIKNFWSLSAFLSYLLFSFMLPLRDMESVENVVLLIL